MLLVLAALAVFAVFAAFLALARRRRIGRGPSLSLRTGKGPAGVSHLAARVSELSDLGLHLPPAVTAPRRRLGALLGLR